MEKELKKGDVVLIRYRAIKPVIEAMEVHHLCVGVVEMAHELDPTCYYVERGEYAAYVWPIECLTKIGTL